MARPAPAPLRVVQLTDLHLLGDPAGRLRGIDTEATLTAVLAAARGDLARADLLLLTGDLAEHGETAAYRRLRAHLDAHGADGWVQALPGNHDDPARLATTFHGTGNARVAALARGAWQLLLLDTSVPGQSAGRLDAAQLAWLDARLGERGPAHALVVVHHPPLPVGTPWLDAIGLETPEPLLALLDRHPRVRGVLCGHVHMAVERRRRGVRHITSPATCVQFVPGSPHPEVDPAPPGWRTLALHADGRIVTRVRRVNPAADAV